MADQTPIDAVKHKDRRVNIPTEELRDFVADEERTPKKVLYPRDPSLDPQLVWRGKDELDSEDLTVEAVPVYIQEKIQPQAIIEEVKSHAQQQKHDGQLSFFSDFNGIQFEDLIDFYHHDQYWTNRMILGDSLLTMTSLAEKEGLRGRVQMVYLDPPYGINFGKNWQVSTRNRDLKETRSEDVTRQPEQIRAFRDTWKDGIHTYLTYLRDRLTVARDLLTESGSIFVQIGDQNMHLVRSVLDEVFGAQNFVSVITFATTSGFESSELARGGDYLLWYGKNVEMGIKYRPLFEPASKQPGEGGYRWVMFPNGTYRGLTVRELRGEEPFPEDAKLYTPDNIQSQGASAEDQTFALHDKSYAPGSNSHWKANFPKGMERLAQANRLHVAANSLRYVRYADDFGWRARNNIWTDTLTGQFTDDKIYVVQTNTKIVERCILMTTDPGDLVLDPTCGSGTTAYAAEQYGRRWITIDTSRVALALARTRLMAARFPYYYLADSPEGIHKDAEVSSATPPAILPPTEKDIRKGFVPRRAPRIKLGAIANNSDIDDIYAKWQDTLTPILDSLNTLLKQSWRDWEVPTEANNAWPKAAIKLHAQWTEGRLARQKEIDASIARHSETEMLYDQPYEDPKRIRVAGPFTVESLSPYRVMSADDERPTSEQQASQETSAGQFSNMIIENLRKAGVQNTVKNERLKFTRLEPYAGEWLHAAGEYQEGDKSKRVAICIGPEHGTVGPELIKDAAKEAVQGVGFDLLIVCGFAFDPHVSEEAKRYGRLPVLVARMNPDLAMGDELLKKTGAGNLFMVFGEPDIAVKELPGARVQVTINGVDVYDPTTGQVRNSSTDDIACWFVDTNYNGESFFVRHAYFSGADDPYEKLRRALRAEIDEAAWSALYATTSMPFDQPTTGKIAIKVINHYGDEVMKVFDLAKKRS